jgi:uncharacterized protein
MKRDIERELLKWKSREQKNSQAEVDYLYTYFDRVLPIEVKTSHIGRLKSLNIFLEEKNSPFGIRISSQSLQLNHKVLSVPFYAISCIDRFLEKII